MVLLNRLTKADLASYSRTGRLPVQHRPPFCVAVCVHKTNVKENRGDSYAGERACHLMMMMMVVMVVVVIVIGIVMVMVIND